MRIVWRALPNLALPAALGLGLAYLATGFVPRPAPDLRPPEELRAKGQGYGDESPMRTVVEKNVLGLETSMFEPLGLPPLEVPSQPEPAKPPTQTGAQPQAAFAQVKPTMASPPAAPAASPEPEPAPANTAPSTAAASGAPTAAKPAANPGRPTGGAPGTQPAHAPSGLDGVRLVGLIAGGERPLAMFSVDGVTLTLRPGESLHGWILEGVAAQEVSFRQGQATRRLTLGSGKRP